MYCLPAQSLFTNHITHCLFFFFNDTATTEIYTLSLHDALPIWTTRPSVCSGRSSMWSCRCRTRTDRKSTRLNSSHQIISYAVFCLKKKKKANHNVKYLLLLRSSQSIFLFPIVHILY